MNRIDNALLITIKKIEDEVTTLNLQDDAAWKDLAAELDSAIKNTPATEAAIRLLVALCIEGLEALAGKGAPQVVSLVEALSRGLHAAACYRQGDPGGDEEIADAQEALKNVLPARMDGRRAGAGNGKNARHSDDECESTEAILVSLDDMAAQLMQLEPDDRDGLTAFRSSLTSLTSGLHYSRPIREMIATALPIIDDLINHRSDDGAARLEEVGQIVEQAMILPEGKQPEECLNVPNTDSYSAQRPAAGGKEIDYMPRDGDPDILKEFVAESMDLISNAEEALLALENDPDDLESVATVFRAFHTIKGSSAFLEVTIIADLAHHAESLLSRVREGEIRYGGSYAELSLYSIDMLKELVQAVEQALTGKSSLYKPEEYDDLIGLLQNPDDSGDEVDSDELPSVAPRMGDILVAQGNVPRETIEEIVERKGEIPLGMELLKQNAVAVKDVAKALRTQKKIKESGKFQESSVRVQTDRLDRLIDMVGEMVIAHSMVAQDAAVVNNRNQNLQKKIAHTSKIVRELQDLSMSMRMVPLKATFQKMARIVRDLANKTGKKVQFITQGEDTEIDRNMVDLINDPLMHMVRNSVDHGIDFPQEREKKGKPREGTIQLSAYHSAGNVVVEIRDDGRGIDRNAIVGKARSRGLLSEEGNLSDREILSLIFEPGFSTATVVTDVSGRGVGLDVVKKNIEALRGKIEVFSEPGNGSVFKIRVPLTLAIIDGMVILVGSERYIIPTISIVRSLRPRKEELSTVLNRGEMLSVEGKLIPLFRLTHLFRVRGAQDDPTQALVVVVEDNGQYAGILADELLGQQQIVIKSLGETMSGIHGISGGAIMGDGRVGLILDIGGLVKIANERVSEERAGAV